MLVLAAPVVAQAPPTGQNVIPDGISFTTQGTVQAIDPAAEKSTVVPKGQAPVSMVAAPGVSLAGINERHRLPTSAEVCMTLQSDNRETRQYDQNRGHRGRRRGP